jgi:hypothetical protein
MMRVSVRQCTPLIDYLYQIFARSVDSALGDCGAPREYDSNSSAPGGGSSRDTLTEMSESQERPP